MSVYVMTVGELAKKRGTPTDELISNLRELGFGIKNASKKLTQKDLDEISLALNGEAKEEAKVEAPVKKQLTNPNVLLLNINNKPTVVLVDASITEDNQVSFDVVSVTSGLSKGEALLEFRKLQGLKMGIN